MVENGNYTLRASPVAGVGGTYATSNGTFKIVTTAAQGPSSFGRQTWKITAVEGKKDTYTIVLLHGHDISLGGSWSLKDNKAVPHGPIITTEEVIEWHITPTNNEIPNTYYIQPITKAVGASYYVGTDEDNQVVINVIPGILLPPDIEAYWQFL
ncbi:uncharacterized protein LACBIDRAFT_293818 [Laccaria bicolor S238N-H82]|uniref:Predicted protein n=1 Tax=Laccaria bicolor (strain S238N-H82 / ATCC MYA-4686) TaxID=486041 RepID=B0D6X9_LACBS|nr:uncharacterized protein LACBIDRAFT_293818 [Laccaria bicolor S238N-H82]EDR09300.1 predicted protein [Laccaria bicolor S238N-H82]|eukprot:XP_001879649.1 predicted protein [Laccaria bicolor S238N-H82]